MRISLIPKNKDCNMVNKYIDKEFQLDYKLETEINKLADDPEIDNNFIALVDIGIIRRRTVKLKELFNFLLIFCDRNSTITLTIPLIK